MSNDDFLNKRLEDMFLSVDRKVSLRYTSFLDESEVAQVMQYIRSVNKLYSQVEYKFWGGFESAKRKVLCVYNIYVEPVLEEFPIKIIQFEYNSKFSKLSHRDFLGSIMALQVKRNSIGDIIIGNGKTQVVVSSNVADVILSEITRIGSMGVTTSIVDNVSLDVQQNFKDISGTVPSLRLDCIISLALNVSRSKASQIIKSKMVTVNYFEQSSQDFLLNPTDVFSVKGFGKYILDCVSEPTKKNRFHVVIKKYL